MSNFPNNFDDDTTLPFVNDNITEIGGDAINALRDAVFAIEQNIGLGAPGNTGSIANRLAVAFNPDGTLKSSAITSLGLVTLPITQDQISNNAQIPESKLKLDHRTQDLFNYIRDLSKDINLSVGWQSITGIKLEPHLIGAIYRHTLDQIDVSGTNVNFLNNKFRVLRDNLNSYTLIKDMNDELLAHQWADGSPFGTGANITTNKGTVFRSYYAHPASGIYLNTSRFNNIPQVNDDIQLLAEYLDNQSLFVLGTRIQNLYSAGISRVSRASNLTLDGYGQFVIPPTPAIAFLKHIGNTNTPFDNIDSGDDIIEFKPPAAQQTNNTFDAKFALVKVGDIVRVNYGTIEVPFLIKEKKYYGATGAKKYIVRIAGKNHFYAPNAIARIDRPLFNNNKYGELSLSPVNNDFGVMPSLVVNNPRGAQALGLGFNASQLDEKHYNLYIALYPTGHAEDGYSILPGIDVTGNRGQTPGLYTLESVVQATNNAFHALGYNYRFSAFTYNGEFGICLSDSYRNAAFSIIHAALKADGTIDTLATQLAFPNNVIELIPTVGNAAPDALGFGPGGSGIASPPYYSTYGSAAASQNPTKLFLPLRRQNYYVNGTEKERLAKENSQVLDGYGDGYWVATVKDVSILSGRVEITYRIPLDLSTSGLKPGKTIVVQSLGTGNLVDFGRFIINDVVFGCAPNVFTDITVHDAVHATGFSPATTIQPFSQVALYFGADSVSFNTESATDYAVVTPFKRHFEVYIDQDGRTFTHERGRINISGDNITVNGIPLYGSSELIKLDIVKISPKLRGYQFGLVNKITLRIFNYSSSTGIYDGYLASYDGTFYTHTGPRTTGRKGQVTRFYDETYTDYIEVIFDANANVADFSNSIIDFQLFPSLQLDDEIMILGTCQVNDTTKVVSKVLDARQFGNISEKDLSSSVFDYMSIPEKYLHSNGVVKGFDIIATFNGSYATIDLTGGTVLVNGRIININNDTVTIPAVKESFDRLYNVNWALCINDLGEYEIVPLLDYDPELITPSNTTRTFTANDVVSNSFYVIPGMTFADLVNSRNNVIPLYIVSATVTGSSYASNVNITVKDARRFIYKKDWNYIPTLVSGSENGDFRNFESLTSWLTKNSNYMSSVNVKGSFVIPTTLSYSGTIRFSGDGAATFSTGGATTGANLEFNTLNLIATSSLTLSSCTLNKVTLTANSNLTFSNVNLSNVIISTSGSSTLTFTNCNFNNVTITLNTNNSVTFNQCVLTNSVINYSASGASIAMTGSKNMWRGNTINFIGSSSSLTLSGSFNNNIVNYLSTSNVVTTSGIINLMENQFNSTSSVDITQFLSVPDGTNGIIASNYFFRKNNMIAAYINGPAVWTNGVVTIADNYFDSSTTDGSNQRLVSNLPIAWIYKNNLNTPSTVKSSKINGTAYTVTEHDEVLLVDLSSAITITLPSINLSPPGRIITIKDIAGKADSLPITIKPIKGDLIEGLTESLVYKNPFGAITLVAGYMNSLIFGTLPNWSIV